MRWHASTRARFAKGAAQRFQRGQALVFIAITAVIVLLVTLATFNVGQLTYHRIKLQNTADAAAYSAAVAHARELNFSAYMNRGVIANQVQVAQIVSLTGWVRNFNDTYNGDFKTISEVLSSLSSLSAMWSVPFDALAAVASPVASALNSAAPVAVKVLDGLIDVETNAAEVYHYAMTIAIPAQIVTNVIQKNEPDASLSYVGAFALGKSAFDQAGFTKSMSPKDRKDGDERMANVTQASTDVFYKDRSLPPIWPIPILIDPTRLVTYGVGPLLMMQFHSGGSTLKSDTGNTTNHLQGWSSLDATGLFVIMCVTIPILGIPLPIPFPLPPLPAGRGAAMAGVSGWESSNSLQPFSNNMEHRNPANDGVDPLAAVQFGAAHINPMTAIPAWIQTAEGPNKQGNNLDSRAGIRKYMELKANTDGATASKQAESGGANQNIIAPPWILEIERSKDTLLTSTTGGSYNIGGGTDGQLNLSASFQQDHIKALSRAEAYFSRPKSLFARDDGKTEWGSLYSPYWQARLAPNGLIEQAASILVTTF